MVSGGEGGLPRRPLSARRLRRAMSAHDRELVLINLLGCQPPVKLAAGLVVPSQ